MLAVSAFCSFVGDRLTDAAMCVQDVSVMCATLCAVESVAARRPQEFKHLVPSLISILKQAGPWSPSDATRLKQRRAAGARDSPQPAGWKSNGMAMLHACELCPTMTAGFWASRRPQGLHEAVVACRWQSTGFQRHLTTIGSQPHSSRCACM